MKKRKAKEDKTPLLEVIRMRWKSKLGAARKKVTTLMRNQTRTIKRKIPNRRVNQRRKNQRNHRDLIKKNLRKKTTMDSNGN